MYSLCYTSYLVLTVNTTFPGNIYLVRSMYRYQVRSAVPRESSPSGTKKMVPKDGSSHFNHVKVCRQSEK